MAARPTLNCLMLLAALLPAACNSPPPESYVEGSAAGAAAESVALGSNTLHESCTQQLQASGEALIYCGAWEQSSARVAVAGGSAGAIPLSQLAANSAWRTSLDQRYDCGAPSSITLLGQPAIEMDCTRKIGGWPQVAVATSVNGKTYVADGVPAALPAIERSIGILSGRLQPADVPKDAAADALAGQRAAEQAVSTGDVRQFDTLIRNGRNANLAENYTVASLSYQAAAELQQKAQPDNPAVATPLMLQALQLSNLGRFTEADALMARAAALAQSPNLRDPTVLPQLWYCQALNLINQGKAEPALALLEQAEVRFTSLLPADALTGSAASSAANSSSRRALLQTGGGGGLGDALADQVRSSALQGDVIFRTALPGVIEARRYRAVALRMLGRLDESAVASVSANQLAEQQGWTRLSLAARLYRSSAMIAEAGRHDDSALSQLATSAALFGRTLPGSKPLAETEFLRAAALAETGEIADALTQCRAAAALLRELKAGAPTQLIEPCLEIYGTQAGKADPALQQILLAEMFELAQLAQANVTSQQIAQASARLAENARDPHVAEAIRELERTTAALNDLYRRRDELTQAQAGGAATDPAVTAEAERRITAARQAKAEAEAALQSASPNYGQLVQQVVTAPEVLAALHPHEAFVGIALTRKVGWSFLLYGGKLQLGRIDGGEPRMADLVKRFRSSMEFDSGEPPAFDTEAAQLLYSGVLGTFATRLDDVTALVVAPSGPLLSVPFAAFLTGPADSGNLGTAPWLIRRMTVAHVPAAANFVSLRKIAGGSRAHQAWFGFGDFRPVTLRQAETSFPGSACVESAQALAGLPPLPGAHAELETVRRLLSAPPSDELLAAAFTTPAVLKTNLKDYRILHFATHALLPSDLSCENQPAVVTSAPDGATNATGALLTAADITSLDLDADAVILSACNSGGANGGTAGESLSGLARSFFYSGARALLVTHWSVNDRFIAYLVALTLDQFRSVPQNGLAAALAVAQRRILDEATGSLAAQAHPFYWAPLALIGEGGMRGGSATTMAARQ
jgi:CHAT domain-containing protein